MQLHEKTLNFNCACVNNCDLRFYPLRYWTIRCVLLYISLRITVHIKSAPVAGHFLYGNDYHHATTQPNRAQKIQTRRNALLAQKVFSLTKRHIAADHAQRILEAFTLYLFPGAMRHRRRLAQESTSLLYFIIVILCFSKQRLLKADGKGEAVLLGVCVFPCFFLN